MAHTIYFLLLMRLPLTNSAFAIHTVPEILHLYFFIILVYRGIDSPKYCYEH